MATTTTRRHTSATPARWQKALARAIDGGVQVRQLGSTGQWIATSATDPMAAYEIGITNGIAHDCTCKAGAFGDQVCCHKARYYHLMGLLDLDLDPDPDPEPPTPAAPAPAALPCFACDGRGWELAADAAGAWFRVACLPCEGTGIALADEEPAGLDAEPRDTAAHDAPYDHDPRPAVPAPRVGPPAPGTVACGGCGRVGYLGTAKPAPVGWRCPRCRPAVPTPITPPPADPLAVAALLAA